MNKNETYLKNWNNNSSLKNVPVKNRYIYHLAAPKFNTEKEKCIITTDLDLLSASSITHISLPVLLLAMWNICPSSIPLTFSSEAVQMPHLAVLWETQLSHTISYLPFGVSSSICDPPQNQNFRTRLVCYLIIFLRIEWSALTSSEWLKLGRWPPRASQNLSASSQVLVRSTLSLWKNFTTAKCQSRKWHTRQYF